MKPRTVLATFVVLAVSAIASPAKADDVDRCVAASERGQSARRRRALIEARTAFIECSANVCPSVVRTACGEWRSEVEATLPSVVLAATTADDRDVPSAKMTIDGQPIADGAVVPLDPGDHTVEARAEGYEDTTVHFVAREADRSRVVRVVRPKRPSPSSASARHVEIRPVTWITGGLSVLALGSFAFLGATSLSEAEELRTTCSPSCPEERGDALSNRLLFADLSLVAAVVLGGVSVWTLLSRPSGVAASAARR